METSIQLQCNRQFWETHRTKKCNISRTVSEQFIIFITNICTFLVFPPSTPFTLDHVIILKDTQITGCTFLTYIFIINLFQRLWRHSKTLGRATDHGELRHLVTVLMFLSLICLWRHRFFTIRLMCHEILIRAHLHHKKTNKNSQQVVTEVLPCRVPLISRLNFGYLPQYNSF